MKRLFDLLGIQREEEIKTLADYQREELVDSGKEQFEKILNMGLQIYAVPLQ
jgi:hypothetical protein